MLRAEITAESLHQRQADCLPGRFGLVVTRIEEGRLDAELAMQPWMLAPNGYLHAASVLLLADTSCRLRLHRPPARRGEELHHHRAEEQLPRHRARRHDPLRMPSPSISAGRPTSGRRRCSAPTTSARAVSLHAADPVVSGERAPPRPRRRPRRRGPAPAPLADREIDELQRSARRGAGAARAARRLVARRLPVRRARPADARSRRRAGCAFVTDADGRALPRRLRRAPLHALVAAPPCRARRAIERRQWFDPWVFELDDEGAEAGRTMPTTRAGSDPGLPVGRRLRGGARDSSPALLALDETALTSRWRCSIATSTPTISKTPTTLLAEIEIARAAGRPGRGGRGAGARDPAAGRRRATSPRAR